MAAHYGLVPQSMSHDGTHLQALSSLGNISMGALPSNLPGATDVPISMASG